MKFRVKAIKFIDDYLHETYVTKYYPQYRRFFVWKFITYNQATNDILMNVNIDCNTKEEAEKIIELFKQKNNIK